MRGSEELLGGEGTSNNASITIKTEANGGAENNNEAKKVKLNSGDNGAAPKARPSKVVHIRNIPSDVSETEIVHLGIPFGRVSNVLVLKGKNQAFLELADESAAVAMVSYFTNCLAQLRGRSVYVQFSTHKELKTDQSHSNANSAAQAALQAAQALVGQGDTQGGPNTVLRVIVEQMLYPVTLDVLYQIFSRVGKVLRIVTFTKNGFFQALIQYPDVVMAQAAKLTLDGQNIYNGCCTLRIEYSKLASLNVRYNNDKSRDYTNPTLPTGEAGMDAFALNLSNPSVLGNPFPSSPSAQQLSSGLAAIAQGQLGPHQQPNRSHQTPHHFLYQIGGLPGLAGFGSAPPGAMPGSNMQVRGGGLGNLMAPGCVLLVSNLNEETISPEGLFTLFGVYGDVQRVKILFNKKDSALVQMREPAQAQLAMTYLDRLKLQGKMIRVTISKHGAVQMPKEGQPDAGLTKDYTNSPLHRFKKPDSKNYQNIYAPSATLHLSNIPASVQDEEICEAFRNTGFNVKGFKFFPKDRKMALLQLPSIEDAAEALIKMHNYQLRENSHLRVSFSKSTI